jgi:diacylglycerol kinase family enzyme
MAAGDEYRAVFVIGGDGTVGQAAAGLIGSRTALGVLPAGTANVWALETGMRAFTWPHLRVLQENARLLASAKAYPIDVGLCNHQPFLMWAGIGLDALSVRKLEPRKRFEKYIHIPEYFAATVWNATMWHGMNLQVTADHKHIEGHYLLAVATNIRHYVGGVAQISPSAFLDDGLMDLWLFSGSNLADAFRHFFDMLSRRHLTSDQARCIPFSKALIESSTPVSVQMDGEPMLGAREISLSVAHGELYVLLPPHATCLLTGEKS